MYICYMNTKEYILESDKIHKGKYSYINTVYINAKEKVNIICPIHGEFSQNPYSHKKGFGCNKCAIEERALNKKININDYIKECNKIHNNKYDYSKIKNLTQKNKIPIICPEHGEFKQNAFLHKNGSGCPTCFNEKKKTNLKCDTETFLDKISGFNNFNTCDFSKVNYVNAKTPITIICSKHGEFNRLPDDILRRKNICLKCHPKKTPINKITTKEYIKRGNDIHDNFYVYDKTIYINPKKSLIITCPKHGDFKQIAYNHINKTNPRGCKKCSLKYNNQENEIKDFIKSLNISFKSNNRKILDGQELDIYIPSKNLAIEYNGLYWHSEKKVGAKYHLNKTELCESKDIQLIHIFEDELLFKKNIVKSRLKNILGITENKIYGRKCEIREVETKIGNKFLNDNHIQSATGSSIKIGLYYSDELVSLMTFSKPRKGIGSNYDGYELVRFVNKLNTTVIGGFSKLLKYFIKTYEPKKIVSYADRRWSQGHVYEKNGFKLDGINKPNYWYIIKQERKHRFGFRKQKLKDEGFDITKTEKQIMNERGIDRIYDCGTLRFILDL